MNEKGQVLSRDRDAEAGGAGNLLCRLIWMFAGPVTLAIVVYHTVAQGDVWFAMRDIVFAAAVALMIGARWVEMRSGKAQTATGEPATMAHFRRYITVLLPVVAIVWLAAKVVGHHLLR